MALMTEAKKGGKTMDSVNPATGRTIKSYPQMTPQEVEAIIEQAHQAFLAWRTTSFAERAKLMKAAASVLRDGKQQYPRLLAQAMGYLLQQGTAREAAATARVMGRMPYARTSFERVGHAVSAQYLGRQAAIEAELSEA